MDTKIIQQEKLAKDIQKEVKEGTLDKKMAEVMLEGIANRINILVKFS